MAITQFRSKRKITGGKYKRVTKKTKNKGSTPYLVTVGELKKTSKRTRGNHSKYKMFTTNIVNLLDPQTKKYVIAKVESVIENTSNINYVRRNIITKGAIIQTDKGKAKITSRPGQEGTLNGILIK